MTRRAKAPRSQVGLRVSEDMRIRLEEAANKNGCSINSEIIERLTWSFESEDRLGGPRVVELIETIAAVMKSTGEHAGFTESGKLTNRGEWLALPYAFDQAVKAALTILDHHRPPGKIVVPKPNVVEVIGVRGTKVDPKESKERVRRLYAELGELFALKEIRDREEKK